MAYDESVMGRMRKNRTIPEAIGRFGTILATGKPPVEQDTELDQLIKYNTLQTGSPEFRMQEAQTRANIGLQSALDIEDAKRQRNFERAKNAGVLAGGEPPAKGPSMPTSMPAPNVPTANGSSFGITTPSNIPTNVNSDASPMGKMSGPSYIQVPKTPPTPKYDESIGAEIMQPATFEYEIDPRYKQQLENEGAISKEEGKLQVKRSDFGKTVDAFRAIADRVPRKYGADRFVQGAKNTYARTMQNENDPLASASATYEGAKNNLRISIARLKDVGNLSETEQKAADALTPQDIDSPQVYETKMAYLDALAGVTTPEEIKALVNGWATGQAAPKKGDSGTDFSSMSDEELLRIANGG